MCGCRSLLRQPHAFDVPVLDVSDIQKCSIGFFADRQPHRINFMSLDRMKIPDLVTNMLSELEDIASKPNATLMLF